MPDHPGFHLEQTNDRSIVRLRVRPQDAEDAANELQISIQALRCSGEDPAARWLGPDQWLFTSDTKSAQDIISHIDSALTGRTYAATDMSSGSACFSLVGPSSRTVLAMGCGIDMHSSSFAKRQCVRTHFANVPLFIVVVGENDFDLYIDRSYARYLEKWFVVYL